MSNVVSVKFSFASGDLLFDATGVEVQEGDHVICNTDRGTEIGLVTKDPQQMPESEASQFFNVIRVADADDLDRADKLAVKGEQAGPVFRRLIEESHLEMKPVGVEYIFGGEKVVCYFAAEERVDFRQLVRDLSRELHERVDMRQIGVREEAGLIGGYGHCGQELCCARFGSGFDPVSIRMAKEQDLPLNSTKISGACGRLMCCLRYEFEAYRDFKSRAPKKNAVIETPLGKAKIIEYDTPKEQLALRLESGKQVRIPLASMEASEAAHKKSKDLGCPCRPDTVTREAMDLLESPEIKQALAEIDRENGILPAESSDPSDIFVDTARSNDGGRKRRKRSDDTSQSSSEGSGRGRKAQRGAQQSASKDKSSSSSDAPKRRRRRSSGAAGSDQQGKAAQPAEQRTRRRHHDSANGSAPSSNEQSQPKSGVKRTRKPGDKGGIARQQANEAPKQQSKKPAAEGEAPKRRRRRRGGGKGKPGGEGSASASE